MAEAPYDHVSFSNYGYRYRNDGMCCEMQGCSCMTRGSPPHQCAVSDAKTSSARAASIRHLSRVGKSAKLLRSTRATCRAT
jgi:hypothetical protein